MSRSVRHFTVLAILAALFSVLPSVHAAADPLLLGSGRRLTGILCFRCSRPILIAASE
jgi:hypothetical protein